MESLFKIFSTNLAHGFGVNPFPETVGVSTLVFIDCNPSQRVPADPIPPQTRKTAWWPYPAGARTPPTLELLGRTIAECRMKPVPVIVLVDKDLHIGA